MGQQKKKRRGLHRKNHPAHHSTFSSLKQQTWVFATERWPDSCINRGSRRKFLQWLFMLRDQRGPQAPFKVFSPADQRNPPETLTRSCLQDKCVAISTNNKSFESSGCVVGKQTGGYPEARVSSEPVHVWAAMGWVPVSLSSQRIDKTLPQLVAWLLLETPKLKTFVKLNFTIAAKLTKLSCRALFISVYSMFYLVLLKKIATELCFRLQENLLNYPKGLWDPCIFNQNLCDGMAGGEGGEMQRAG